MSDNKTDDEIKERLKQIFPSPQVASQVANIVVSNRPAGWGPRSNAPYFKRIYAEQIKTEIDKQIDTGNELVFSYAMWCNEERGGMSKKTLYNRVNQSIRYLCEKMDIDGKYSNWYERVHISQEPGKGVIIRFIKGLDTHEPFTATEAIPRELKPVWQRRLDEWLESGSKDTPFIQEKLALSPEEIVKLKQELSLLTNIIPYITANEVKIIKL